MKMHILMLLVLIALPTVLPGCASLKAYPDRATDPVAEIETLKQYLEPQAITKYEAVDDSARGGLSKKAWRNEVVNARVRAADLYFNKFQQGLFQEGVGFGVATDWTVLALNAAGSLATGGAVNALAAASAGIVGAKAAFDRNAYFEKTMPGLVATMSAKRKEILVRIRSGLSNEIEEYPLVMALNDLENYYYAGSIPGAIIEVAEAAGDTAKKADAELEKITIVTLAPADLQVRREKMADYVKTLDQQKLDGIAKSIGVRSGDKALVDILTEISKAGTTKSFNILSQKIKILSGKEF
jgi:hypothetical protein